MDLIYKVKVNTNVPRRKWYALNFLTVCVFEQVFLDRVAVS